jgi:predicted DsbA family dithiol-disulfide isomerase
MSVIAIDVYADIVCPWCFIGSRRLDAALSSLGRTADVEIRHSPFVLHPDAPATGIELRAMLENKYGVDPGGIFRRVEAAARESGIPLDFSKQRYTYSTVAAHTLLRHAAAKRTQHGLADSLFVAYFLSAENIADPDVLAVVAGKHGFTAGEVKQLVHDTRELAVTRQNVQDAVRKGIRGVPVFVLNHKRVLAGAQPTAVIRAAIANAMESVAGPAAKHHHTPEEERQIREAALDETIASTFPASDPPSSIPNPDDHGDGR